MAKYKNSPKGKLAKHNWLRVNENATYVEDYDTTDPLVFVKDADGYKYVNDGWDNTYADEAVANGFLKKIRFRDSEGYYITHKDGNIDNCAKDNLEWEELMPGVTPKTGHVYFEDCIVGKDGTLIIRDGKIEEMAQIRERWFEDDLNATWIFENPRGVTYEIHGGCDIHNIDEYMAKAGYVKGDKSKLHSPVILHKDHDVSNFHSDNLEWVESDDPRYIEYDRKRKQRQKDLIKSHNQDLGYPIPSYWPQ